MPVVDGRATGSRKTFGLAPMDRPAVTDSACTVSVTKDGQPFDDLVRVPVLKSAPAGLWGSSMQTGMGGDAMLDDLVMGYRFEPKPLKAPTTTVDRSVDEFAYDIKPRPDAFDPLRGRPAPTRTTGDPAAVASNATSKTTAGRRHSILAGLGLDPTKVTLSDLAGDPHQAFVAAPEVVR